MKPIKPKNLAQGLILVTLPAIICIAHADEIRIDPPGVTEDVTRLPDQTIWFDSANNDGSIAFSTLNGELLPKGNLPGWAHTKYSFVKFTGTHIVEIPNTEKVLGGALFNTTTATSVYYDNLTSTNVTTNREVGWMETTRDVAITGGVTLDIVQGGLIFHNSSHWVKSASGTPYLTSSSGQLVAISNGGGNDYAIQTVVIKDPSADSPLQFIKTGPDPLIVSGNNTFTGGTLVLNGILRVDNSSPFGTGTVKVQGNTSQVYTRSATTINNPFEIVGEGPTQQGALRLGNSSALAGSVTLTGPATIAAHGIDSGFLNGPLIGEDVLSINHANNTSTIGTVTINGSAVDYTGIAQVQRGRLNVNSAFGGSISVLGGAGLGGKGTIAGDIETGGNEDSPRAILYVDGSQPGALSTQGEFRLFGPTEVAATSFPATGTSFTVLNYGSIAGDLELLTVSGLRGASIHHNTDAKSIEVDFAPLDLVWSGETNANWSLTEDLNFKVGAEPNRFFSGDRVIFNDDSTVAPTLVGRLYPREVVFDRDEDLVVAGTGAGISGQANIIKNGTGTVKLGGETSNFTGTIHVNEGILIPGNYQSFGNASNIVVAEGAQVDLDGTLPANVSPPQHYTYTISGAGPDGLGAITNTSSTDPMDRAGIRHLVLAGDASIGGNKGRFDFGLTNGVQGTVTGNGHTLTKVGSCAMAFRGNAGGSPIKIVIAEGLAFAENHDNAWGGATGSLTIKANASAATYGNRTLATPVTIESHGTLTNQGGGTGTWTGPISVTGQVTLGAGSPVVLSGPVTGTASVTKTGGNTLTVNQPNWVGDTTINAGTMVLDQPNLDDNSAVQITNAVLNLNFSGVDQVRALVVDGERLADGIYTAETLPTRLAGTGSLHVVSGEVSSGYAGWAAANGLTGVSAAVDSDGDGVANGIEFVIGGTSMGPNSDSSALLPLISTDDDYLVFSYRRSTASNEAPLAERPYVQYSSDFNTWTTATDGTDGVLIEVGTTEVEPGIFPVTVKIPRARATDGKIFARLRVDIP
jgi:autotransporter-associated beta strand protein